MGSLNEACHYLMNHWDTYNEMKAIESEINKKYLTPMSENIQKKLMSHSKFPNDWLVEVETDEEDGAQIYALPKEWEHWNKHGDWLGCVGFYNLCISELMADKREDRSWFTLEISLGKRKDQLSKKSAKKLWLVSENYSQEFNGFDRPQVYDQDYCYQKPIDRVSVEIFSNEEKLISLVVEGIIPVIKAVDKIKSKHFPKNPPKK